MSRCLELMTLWRDNLWPVMHLKRIAQAAWFNPASNLTDWIAELKPRPGELTFEHPLPSAYSSTRFAEYMSNMRNIRCVLMGFSLDETVLSTVVDGFHRSHRYQVVGDAVACRRPGVGDAASYKQAVVRVIGNFAGDPGKRRPDRGVRQDRGMTSAPGLNQRSPCRSLSQFVRTRRSEGSMILWKAMTSRKPSTTDRSI